MTKMSSCCDMASKKILFKHDETFELLPCVLLATGEIGSGGRIGVDPVYSFEATFVPIVFCPWCGKKLVGKRKKDDDAGEFCGG